MNTEELYIWRYGIDKLPKGLLEYGKFDVCDTYDESKRQRFQTKWRWMWKDKNGWEENLPPVLYLVCNKKPGILQFDFCDQWSIKLKIVSEEFLSLLQENGFIDKYDIATVKVVNKKNESLTDKKYYALRINHFDNDSFHYGKGITFHQNDVEKKLGISFTVYPDMKLKDNSIKQNFFVLNSIEYGDGIIFRESVLDKVLNLYKPEIYKLSDYSKLWINKGFYPYGNEFMIVK
ncbi:Imm43 family immunity protein [Coprobacter secundus]|uniref:Imm43 family immunity protein n=1 Tax=Coprobacter secundus TaxID=1501392 RepID=UPI0023F896BE|nr:Imm43 family immunity protein [Coprobacter secundus]